MLLLVLVPGTLESNNIPRHPEARLILGAIPYRGRGDDTVFVTYTSLERAMSSQNGSMGPPRCRRCRPNSALSNNIEQVYRRSERSKQNVISIALRRQRFCCRDFLRVADHPKSERGFAEMTLAS